MAVATDDRPLDLDHRRRRLVARLMVTVEVVRRAFAEDGKETI
jgi:hypothetical protein